MIIYRGQIEIGPFSENIQGKHERLVFRLIAPPFNPVAEPYASGRKANIEGKYIIFYNDKPENVGNEFDEYDQIDLTFFEKEKVEWLKNNGLNIEDIYMNEIYQFGFDNNTYKQYSEFYESICKAIAARTYYYFSTAKTEEDNMPIKELCEKFGEVTNEEITYYIAREQGIDLDMDNEEIYH